MADLHCECQELKPNGEKNSSFLVLHPSSGVHTIKTIGSHLKGYFHKLIILSCGRLRFHKQDLEHEKHINARKFSMSYEERQWPGAFSLPMLYTKGIDQGILKFSVPGPSYRISRRVLESNLI